MKNFTQLQEYLLNSSNNIDESKHMHIYAFLTYFIEISQKIFNQCESAIYTGFEFKNSVNYTNRNAYIEEEFLVFIKNEYGQNIIRAWANRFEYQPELIQAKDLNQDLLLDFREFKKLTQLKSQFNLKESKKTQEDFYANLLKWVRVDAKEQVNMKQLNNIHNLRFGDKFLTKNMTYENIQQFLGENFFSQYEKDTIILGLDIKVNTHTQKNLKIKL